MKLPEFTNDQEEAQFWDSHDSTEFLAETEPVDITFVDTRPPKKQISLRLDPDTIERLKAIAERKGIGYQTLIRIWVMEKLGQEGANPNTVHMR
ncbi:MAG: CopG family antitoxin [Anaerolineae bacterium]